MMAQNTLQNDLVLFCDKHGMLSCSSLLVAFSGGADSVALLSLLQPICQTRKIRLAALHVNHNIRKEEAERDAAFCRDFCQKRGIEFALFSVDIPALAQKKKEGLEECARNERYRLLSEYITSHGYEKIATAHNATDNMETVLFHLTRGASLQGVGGIPPVRGNIIRPLLPFSKEEILAYLHAEGIPYVTDSTNEDTAYTRNHIRHNILPLLRKINPEAENAVFRFTQIARRDEQYLTRIAESYHQTDDTHSLAALDDAILTRVLLIKLANLANNEISEIHLNELLHKIHSADCGDFSGSLSLPGKITATITPQRVSFSQALYKAPFSYSEKTFPLSLGKDLFFADRYRIRLVDEEGEESLFTEAPLFSARFLKSAVCGEIYVRSRHEGDCFVAGGMTRKIKKMLCDKHLSLEERATLPILCDSEGILYVPHLSTADRVKANADSLFCYRIDIFEI